MEVNKRYNDDCLKIMKTFDNYSVNMYYTDTPYNLGSRYEVDSKGHIVFKGKGLDFMNKWEAMDGYWWDKYFQEVNRTLKYGGFWISHNIDRQSWLWSYYAVKNGLIPMQKLYWLFVSNFPKAMDVTLQLDKLMGQERVVIGKSKGAQKIPGVAYGTWGQNANEDGTFNRYIGTSTIAQKYQGYYYGMSSLKQCLEEILVFMKEPLDSVSKDIIAYEKGNKKIHPSLYNLEINAVIEKGKKKWTPQLLLYDKIVPKLLENKSINHSSGAKLVESLPKIAFFEDDLIPYFFEPKVQKDERDEGLDNFEDVTLSDGRNKENFIANSGRKRKNPHPSPKPKRLVKWILNLFKPPDQILVVDTFMGSGVIPQCCAEMGIDYIGTEIDPTYFEVSEAKIDYSNNKLNLFQGDI